jgi:FkbM family methyltransferase
VRRLRALSIACSYRLVTSAPRSAVGRARTSSRLAPVLEVGFSALGVPLFGTVAPVAHGPAAGLRLVGERRSLAWLSGTVERNVQEAIVAHLRLGSTFVDVGASIGFFSLLAARVVGPSGRVLAFEPQAAAVQSVRRNAELNGFSNVIAVETALGSSSGEAVLTGVGRATAVVASARDVRARGVPVRRVTFDAYVDEHPTVRPDLVKIDVEGTEGPVLDGMRGALAAHRPILIVECHDAATAVVSRLADAGYVASIIGSSRLAADAGHGDHLLALPANRVAEGRAG